MTNAQRLFLIQARSDFGLFVLLRDHGEVHPCHALHYLQMATEKLGKASAWRNGPQGITHRAFVSFLRSLQPDKNAQRQLGYAGKNEKWAQLIRTSLRLADLIEKLAPKLAKDDPNPEYPWPPADPSTAPCEYDFPLWNDLTNTDSGRRFLQLVTKLFATAEAYL